MVALWAIFLYFTETKNNKEREIKKKVAYYKKYSPTFIKKIKEENLNLDFLEKEGLNTDEKKIKKILFFVENNKEIQIEIKNNIQKINKRLNSIEESLKKKDYYAYKNLDLILELKKVERMFNYEVLENLINKMYPNENVSRKLEELLENKIICKDFDTGKYKLDSNVNFIQHPYKLDEKGKPFLLEIDNLIKKEIK